MRKRQRRGGLVRKQRLTQTEKQFRVLSIDIRTKEAHGWGTYATLDEAFAEAKEVKTDGLEVYIHGDSNRVISKV